MKYKKKSRDFRRPRGARRCGRDLRGCRMICWFFFARCVPRSGGILKAPLTRRFFLVGAVSLFFFSSPPSYSSAVKPVDVRYTQPPLTSRPQPFMLCRSHRNDRPASTTERSESTWFIAFRRCLCLVSITDVIYPPVLHPHGNPPIDQRP